jgi:hypothetical protein
MGKDSFDLSQFTGVLKMSHQQRGPQSGQDDRNTKHAPESGNKSNDQNQTPGRQSGGQQSPSSDSSKSPNTPGRNKDEMEGGSCGCDATQGSSSSGQKQQQSSGGSRSDNK